MNPLINRGQPETKQASTLKPTVREEMDSIDDGLSRARIPA
jgi:hypothetical protein